MLVRQILEREAAKLRAVRSKIGRGFALSRLEAFLSAFLTAVETVLCPAALRFSPQLIFSPEYQPFLPISLLFL